MRNLSFLSIASESAYSSVGYVRYLIETICTGKQQRKLRFLVSVYESNAGLKSREFRGSPVIAKVTQKWGRKGGGSVPAIPVPMVKTKRG